MTKLHTFMYWAAKATATAILAVIVVLMIFSLCGCFTHMKRTEDHRIPVVLKGEHSFHPYSSTWWCLRQWTFTYDRSSDSLSRSYEAAAMIVTWPAWVVDWPFEVVYDTLALPHDIWWSCNRPDISAADQYRYLMKQLREAREDAYNARKELFALTNKVSEAKQ